MDANSGIEAAPRRQPAATRGFSPAVSSALAAAAVAFTEDPIAGDEALRNAIVAAVSEARAMGWQGSEVIAAMRASVPAAVLAGRQREALETTIGRRAMIAFFGANDAVF